MGYDDITKRLFSATFKSFDTDVVVGFNQRNMRNEVQKTYLFSLSEDTNKKDVFGGQFVSLYFRPAIINVVNEVLTQDSKRME